MISVGQLGSGRTLLRDQDASATTPAVSSGMCDLLRDASLLVVMQRAGGEAEGYEPFRKRCTLLIERFAAALDQRGYAEDVCREAVDALCALVDEVAIRFLGNSDKEAWLSEPLQVALFQKHNAGEFVFERLEARMRETSPQLDLLECYATILALGFTGRYALEGEAKRQTLMRGLSALLTRLRPASTQSFLTNSSGQYLGNWYHRFYRRLSPWAIAGLALLCAISMWLAWHVALDGRSASFLSQPDSSVTAP
ncbi:DotU family type IV/VI secretion system protein [Caballeronia sp. ATUFL_M2_KS44]|uniref:DotU family type IV/VI secretion system protein n=1 Tax=Caballeronia sp. ATUFL_M2_KS44 TaxID=2921767 RepID=UPI00202785C4|nr:DotU family type IV/VI secretion system protein [Caballeronia sp. ATUFL_M2_KS44]